MYLISFNSFKVLATLWFTKDMILRFNRGLWFVCIYMYVNFTEKVLVTTAHLIAATSFFIVLHLHLVCEKVVDMNVMGFSVPFCCWAKQAPAPISEASSYNKKELLLLTDLGKSGRGSNKLCLNFSKTSRHSLVHLIVFFPRESNRDFWDLQTSGYISLIEIYHAQKLTKFSYCCRRFKTWIPWLYILVLKLCDLSIVLLCGTSMFC